VDDAVERLEADPASRQLERAIALCERSRALLVAGARSLAEAEEVVTVARALRTAYIQARSGQGAAQSGHGGGSGGFGAGSGS
jgi:hypothetical protein